MSKTILVIDANIIMSSLIATQGKTFDIILNEKVDLYAPDYTKFEIEKYKQEILEKSDLSEKEFNTFLTIVLSNLKLVKYGDFSNYVEEAGEITPDHNDTEYFALALKLNCSIWSNDKKLKEQNKVKVHSTHELLKILH